MQVSRRTVFALASLSTLGAAAAAVAAAAPAPTKLGKADVNFQLTPKDGARCGGCASFRPGPSGAVNGSCVLVDGPIPPNAWCVLFSAAKRK